MLDGTPYLLEGDAAAAAVRAIADFDESVRLLRGAGTLDDATLARLREEWRVEQVYETVGIEGNQLDLNETRLVLARGITISGKPTRDSAEAVNMRLALDYLEKLAQSREPLTASALRQIHALVLGNEPGAGEFRRTDIEISGASHTPPPPIDVPPLVDESLAWLASADAYPSLLTSAVIHAWLAHIHPFSDGNGRTARALMNLVLIKSGAPIVLIRRKDRAVYYDALAASDDGDIAPLLDLVIKRSRDSLRQIQRIRAAEAGVTEAVVRAREAAKKEYEAWRYAMLLLLAEIDRSAQRAREASGGAVEIRVREYDQVTADDFGALLNRDPSGNGWLALLRGIGPNGVRGELLLWIGFRSREIQQLGGVSGAGADIFVSESDPEKTHGPFRVLDERSAFPILEIAFDGDRYLVRERTSDGERAIRLGAAALGARIVEEFIGGYLTSVVTAATS